MTSIFNKAFGFLFGLLQSALSWLGPFWSLVVISFIGGVFMVWLFGKVSDQDKIKSTRNRMSAELIGLRLFKDDLRVFFSIQWSIFVWTLKYLRYSVVPMIIIMVPVIALLTQLNLHYAMAPLEVGEQTLIKAKLRNLELLNSGAEITLKASDALEIETAGVRIPETGEVAWRVRGVSDGRFDLVVTAGDESVTKQMAVGGRKEGVSQLRTGDSWINNLLYPGEAPISKQSAIESIEIIYPDLDISFLGFGMNWLILFFILSMVFGFALKGTLGVSI
jgi:uncharacterized membrane protein (DUF106 family)